MKEILDHVRERRPLIHNITNYVTANDVANMLLACGARPIMADDAGEAEEITSLCDGLNINIGTLNQNRMNAMLLAGRRANELGHAVLLDPVGVGASRQRMELVRRLMEQIHFDAIRGNVSEMRTLASGCRGTGGVEADAEDAVTEENLDRMMLFAKRLACEKDCIIAITGAIDLVADQKRCFVIRGGRPEMGRITGTGCQLSGLMTACLAVNRETSRQKLEAAAAAVCAMGLAGKTGWSYMQPYDGNAAYRNRIIDAVYHMTGEQLEEGAEYELY